MVERTGTEQQFLLANVVAHTGSGRTAQWLVANLRWVVQHVNVVPLQVFLGN